MSYTLLAEDNQAHALLFERCLGAVAREVCVEHVRDGEAALAFLDGLDSDSELPILVVLDIRLPKLNGFQVLQEIRSRELLKDLPVAVLTSSDRDTDRRSADAYGASAFWLKPLSAITLERFLNTKVFSNGDEK